MSPPVVPATHLRAFVLATMAHAADAAVAGVPPAAAAPERLGRSLGWAAHLAALGADRLPPAFVHDLGWLVLEGADFAFSAVSGAQGRWDAAQRARRVAYQRRVLAPILGAPWLADVRAAVRGAAAPDEVVARFLQIVHERLADPAAAAPLPPAPARALPRGLRALAASRPSLPWDFAHERAELAALLGAPPGGDPLAAWLDAAATALERTGPGALLGPGDAFELAHLEAFATPAQRLAARRLAALEAAIPPFAARRRALRREPEIAEAELPDAGTFPQGGLAEIARRGSLENLVRSELVYAGEEAVPGADWFTVRLLDHELLYYRRDDGRLHRARRTLHLALLLGPDAGARLPGHPHGPAAYLEALLVAVGRAARALFARDSLALTLSVWSDAPPGDEPERRHQAQRLALALRAGRPRDTPAIDPRATPPDPSLLRVPGRRTQLVRIGSGGAPLLGAADLRAHRAAQVEPIVIALDPPPGAPAPDVVLSSARALADQLAPARDAVLERLLGQSPGARTRVTG